MAGDVEGLVKNADYIVTGKFERSSEAWEMRKEPYYKEGDLYNFKVDTNLLGDLTEIIKVGIPHFQRLTTSIEGKEYSADIIEPHYVKPETDKQYVLFLSKYNDNYVPSVSPFIIEIDDQDAAILKYNSDNAPKTFKISGTESIEFSGDDNDYSEIDEITGMNKSTLIEAIKNQIQQK
ncbi:hypothetical protein [Paenibacillus sp. 7541]|uniref:hypothetical protein n=1 Tax=Paenibacillus sp. 7541 TaxID=2026236 RepID=UPI0015956F88|nr:hypothetical protein [Paenibacillus sp. 7541]